eukprot:10797342-Alexandrium_andersonii.AAC.1
MVKNGFAALKPFRVVAECEIMPAAREMLLNHGTPGEHVFGQRCLFEQICISALRTTCCRGFILPRSTFALPSYPASAAN